MINLQQNLKYLRKLSGKTQQEMADAMNIEKGTYASYEEGRCSPKIDGLITISDYYGTSIDVLVRKDIENNIL